MESLDKYLQRKSQEIGLLNACLNPRVPLQNPACPADVIKQKFQIASALKTEYAPEDWALTETAWAHHGSMRAGPFEFSYDYRRADLEVRGPSFYAFANPILNNTIYASSGMSAISALLLGSKTIVHLAEILILPGSYGETIEFIESYCPHLRVVHLDRPPTELVRLADCPRILLLDSCATAAAFESALRLTSTIDHVVFDTTCFSSGSGRIGRVLRWAHRCEFPIVLVCSHTKLDSLGLEYGRLGSAVFINANAPVVDRNREFLNALSNEVRKAVRLFGGAPLPAHFPPHVGSEMYRALTDRRIASIVRNSRRASRYFMDVLGATAHSYFAHALYITLEPNKLVDEDQAKTLAADLSNDLNKKGLLVRHAGSFGFDFGATEWFHDSITDRYLVRVAIPDMPTALWDEIALAIAQWWSRRERRSSQTRFCETLFGKATPDLRTISNARN
jgi:hypothetical protein